MKRTRNLLIGGAGLIAVVAAGVAVYLLWRGPQAGLPPAPPEPAVVNKPERRRDKPAPVSLADAADFLTAGDKPRQTGLAPGVIDVRRAAVLRGLVQTRDGKPLAGVRVAVEHHPEYGSSVTQDNGVFDMAVNGGGQLCFAYSRDGCLPACRLTAVPWQDYAWLPDVALIPADENVTAVDLTAPAIARGGAVKDKDGERQSTLLFPPDVKAELVLPDGGKKSLTSLHVRATEFTVGDKGPAAMPASLPPNSAYTYCVDFSADEAAAAGAKDVVFSKPLIHYVENFLHFPVGIAVPTGYFDSDKGAWLASDNGRVVKVLAVAGGLADLDLDGKGQAADAKALAALGVAEAERRQLAALYKPGQELWRVPIPHFSKWDCNWGFGPPKDARSAKQRKPGTDAQTSGACHHGGSDIVIQDQVLGEAVDVAGTPFRLHYQSDRVPGRTAAHTLHISVSGEEVPASLKGIELEVYIAGKRETKTFPPKPGQSYDYFWDGKDGYGRTLTSPCQATVRIGYVYDGVYERVDRFGYNGNGEVIEGNRTRQEVTLWQEYTPRVGAWDARSQDLGGWTIDVHHAYGPAGRELLLGDGRRHSGQSMNQTISTIAKRPAGIAGFTFGPDGSCYVAMPWGQSVCRISPEGTIATVASTGNSGYRGDGGPATQAELSFPHALALDRDGNLYIGDVANHCIRRVDRKGIITTVKLTQHVETPRGLAAGRDDSLYIADRDIPRVLRWNSDGTVTTVAGTGIAGFSGDGGPAAKAMLNEPAQIALAPDGSLYIADYGNYCVRKVGTDGIITTVAGVPGKSGSSGDGGLAVNALLSGVYAVAVEPDGGLYIAANHCIRWVRPDGTITTVAGTGVAGSDGDGGPAATARINTPDAVAVGPDGSLYIGEWEGAHSVRRVAAPMPGISVGDIAIPSEDGSELYRFDGTGRHLRTIDAVTKALLYRFDYDAAGRLASITDADDNTTRIARDADGDPVAIVAPFGQRTVLAVNDDGYLAKAANPGEEPVEFAYGDGGLLTGLKDVRGKDHQFHYDDLGRLTRDVDPAGGFTALARTETAGAREVGLTTALKPPTTYRVEQMPDGGEKRLDTCCCGAVTRTETAKNGARTVTLSDGTVLTEEEQPDPRWGMQAPLLKALTVTTPGGRKATLSLSRKADLKDAADPLSLTALTDTAGVNGRNFTSVFDAVKRQVVNRSPLGRQIVTTLDDRSRVARAEAPGLLPVFLTYDDHGRPATVAQGEGDAARVFTFAYDDAGRLASVTDPLKQTMRLEYDKADRVVRQVLPDGRELAYGYDPSGDLNSLTPPGRPAHAFTSTAVGLAAGYRPPGGKEVGYAFNADRQLTQVGRLEGPPTDLHYDKVGRLERIAFAGGEIRLAWDAKKDQLTSLTTADGVVLTCARDGFLLTGVTYDGPVKGSIRNVYSDDFRLASQAVNDGAAVAYQYDDDGLPKQAGGLALTRDDRNGRLTGTTLGKLATGVEYNDYGEEKRFTASHDGKEMFAVAFERDALGRIVKRTEMLEGKTAVYGYAYSPAGRLTDVTRDGVNVAHYDYDANGNRTGYKGPDGERKGEYDDQDRILRYGDATYRHTADGEWLSKTVGGKTTGYVYDGLGNLRSVALPDGTKVEYVIDGENRRIGRKVGGELTQGFLYADDLGPVAELDGRGAVVSRFVYATLGNVPEYMEKGGKTYRIVTDHLGSPRLVIDAATGEVAQRLDYDAFGVVLRDTNPGFQPFGFAGGLYDPQTGLVRFGARDYDAETGRWTTPDPLGFAGGQANLYAYVGNDPVNQRDPSGLLCGTEKLMIGLTAILAAATVYSYFGVPALLAASGFKFMAGVGLFGGVATLGTAGTFVGLSGAYDAFQCKLADLRAHPESEAWDSVKPWLGLPTSAEAKKEAARVDALWRVIEETQAQEAQQNRSPHHPKKHRGPGHPKKHRGQ